MRAEWLPRLRDALDALESAVADRTEAYARVSEVLVRERAVKEDFDISVEKLAGQVRTIFPKDPARWNVIFPSRKSASPNPEPDESETVGA